MKEWEKNGRDCRVGKVGLNGSTRDDGRIGFNGRVVIRQKNNIKW